MSQKLEDIRNQIIEKNMTNFSIDQFIENSRKKTDNNLIIKDSVQKFIIAKPLEKTEFKKNLSILLKKEKINYITENDIISFKIGNLFCKISLIENNQKFDDFGKIPPQKYRCSIHNFHCIYWIDEEEEYNLLDSKIIHLLLSSLYEYKEWVFKDITLDDIYFSKRHKSFYIKNFRDIIPFKKDCLATLKYVPLHILYYKDLFVFGEETITFDEYLQLSSQKNISEVSK